MVQEKQKLDELDEVCIQLNQIAHTYATLITRNRAGQDINADVINEILITEIARCGFPIVNTMLMNAFALVGRCANVATEEGDLVTLDEVDVETGRQMLQQNPQLLGTYVLPLFFYSVEYAYRIRNLIPPDRVRLSDGSLRPDEEYEEIIQLLIGGAVQTRYFHIRSWLNKMALGMEESGDLSDTIVEPGRLIDERD